jgi:hypothetical protein
MQSGFTALKIPCVPPVHLSLLPFPEHPATLILFTVSIVLPFPERYVGYCISYSIYNLSDWLNPPNNMNLRFFYIFL